MITTVAWISAVIVLLALIWQIRRLGRYTRQAAEELLSASRLWAHAGRQWAAAGVWQQAIVRLVADQPVARDELHEWINTVRAARGAQPPTAIDLDEIVPAEEALRMLREQWEA